MDIYHFWPTLGAAVVGLIVGLFLPGGWGRRVRPLADRPALAAVVVALLNLSVNLTTAYHHGLPKPHVNDEYGYLLIADTFLHGRLTNPTPADPDAFASPHVLLHPTYTAKYPPAQAVALAAGQLLGRPVYGVWLSSAAAAVALYWMARGFAPPVWSLLAGLVAAAHPTLADWGYVYWGGDVAVLGGALTVGGWGRLRRDEAPDVHPGLLLGVGLVILAFSRPYEGAILSLPLMASLASLRRLRTPRVLIPLGSVLVIGGAALVLYDVRVTGHPLRLPIAEYAAQRDVAPKFWLLPERSPPPAYPNATLAWMHAKFESAEWHVWQSPPGAAWQTARRGVRATLTFARPGLLLIPFLFAIGRARWLWVVLGVTAVGLWFETFYLEHYAAPAAGGLLAVTVIGWQRLHRWSPRLSRATVIGFAAGSAWAIHNIGMETTDSGQTAVVQLLSPGLTTGRHLLFVEYTDRHVPHDELVYDGADPAAQRLLWVRSQTPDADRAVVRDYPGRQCWLLTVGERDIAPERYSP